jgi:heme/copper-type cytochrome/quinol oxidase subunit 2
MHLISDFSHSGDTHRDLGINVTFPFYLFFPFGYYTILYHSIPRKRNTVSGTLISEDNNIVIIVIVIVIVIIVIIIVIIAINNNNNDNNTEN